MRKGEGRERGGERVEGGGGKYIEGEGWEEMEGERDVKAVGNAEATRDMNRSSPLRTCSSRRTSSCSRLHMACGQEQHKRDGVGGENRAEEAARYGAQPERFRLLFTGTQAQTLLVPPMLSSARVLFLPGEQGKHRENTHRNPCYISQWQSSVRELSWDSRSVLVSLLVQE